jgi:SAM-dependent methyltransferase
MTSQEKLDEWEQAEKKRSAHEASHTDPSALIINDEVVDRYLSPLEETNYPLEYSFYLLGDVRGKDVLDFGCGNGVNSVLLSKREAKVIAMDLSPDLLTLAKQRAQANNVDDCITYLVSSAHDIQLPDESVDVVFGMAILHHLDLNLAAKEVHRVLRKGGRGIFQEPVRNSKVMKFVRGLIPYRSPDVSPNERPLTDSELRSFGEGFSKYHARGFWLPYINLARILPIYDRLIHPMAKFDGMLLRRIPVLGYYAGVRVIELTK